MLKRETRRSEERERDGSKGCNSNVMTVVEYDDALLSV